MVHRLNHDVAAQLASVEFQTTGNPSAGAIYWIDGAPTSPLEGLVGETCFLYFTFTDLGFSFSSFNAMLEIRVQAHFEGPALTGTFLRRVLINLNIHGTPNRYSEFVSYPEAQRQAV